MDADLRQPAVTAASQSRRRFPARWERFWFAEIHPEVFAALRILFGVLGCASLVGLLNLPLFWSCDGLVAVRGSALCGRFVAAGYGWVPGVAVLLFAGISFLAMAVGFRTRVAVVASLISLFMVVRWNNLPLSAAHQVLRSVLFCLVFAECGQVWSLDARRRRSHGVEIPDPRASIWPLRLLQIQIAAVYLITGLWKLNNVMWRDGTALHYSIENAQFRRFAFLTDPMWDPAMTLATYVTLAWELGFAFMLLHPRTRRWALGVGIVMHVGMWATLELGPFGWMMIAGYVAYVDPASLHRRVSESPRLQRLVLTVR